MPEKPLLAQRYRLLTEVGRGGMGTVWHARDEALGRDVAVKEVILPHGFSDEEREIQHKRTFREARTAARLSHPGVVAVYDVVEEDDRPWIVMELIRARSLEQIIKQDGPLSPRRAAEIGRQMLAALMAAHEAGILHRDVKPSNVLVIDDRFIRAVLTDFGIARAQSDATLTQTGMLIGSPAYIAPERARGRAAVPASDLWSLGATLYAAVEGKAPFERPEAMASLVAVLTEEPPVPEHAGPLTPLIRGLLRKDADTRLSAAEAAVLLDRVLIEEPPQPRRSAADDAASASATETAVDPPETDEAGTAGSRPEDSAAADSGTAMLPVTGQVMALPESADAATEPPAGAATEAVGPVTEVVSDAASDAALEEAAVEGGGRGTALAIAVALVLLVAAGVVLTFMR